jgi:large conductance mechanosensitive channel
VKILDEFRHFIQRGNVIDLAVGVIMGAAFGKIVTSLVEGILMPPMGMILGRIDFKDLFYVLDYSKGTPKSLTEAKSLGVPVIAYGQLINDIIGFLLVAIAVFVLVKQVNRLKAAFDRRHEEEVAANTKECPHCISPIAKKATRCPHCTAQLEAA